MLGWRIVAGGWALSLMEVLRKGLTPFSYNPLCDPITSPKRRIVTMSHYQEINVSVSRFRDSGAFALASGSFASIRWCVIFLSNA